jgi:hypothetical protein
MAESDDILEARLGGFLVKYKDNDGDSQAQTKAETRETAHIDPFGIDFVSMAMFIIGKFHYCVVFSQAAPLKYVLG